MIKAIHAFGMALVFALAAAPLVSSVADDKQAAAQEKTWTINVQNADIRALVNQVADMTGKNFILDPRVRAQDITVVSRQSLTSDEVYELFLAVLQVNGYSAIPSDSVVKIVPSTTAKSYNLPLGKSISADGQGLVTAVLTLKELSATELVPVLRPLVPQYGHLAAVASSNALVISDHEDNIKRMEAIIARLEVDGDSKLEVIPLEHAWVGDVVAQIEGLIPQTAEGRGKAKSAGEAVLVADERTNRLLFKGDRHVLQQINELVKHLDVPSEEQGNLQMIRLNHGNAKEMAELLGNFFSAQASAAKGKNATTTPNGEVAIFADESLNALVISADVGTMKQLRNIVNQLDARRSQVLIEAAIVEVSAGKSNDLGVQWVAGDLNKGVGGTNFTGNQLSTTDVIAGILGSQSGTSAPVGLADGITAGGGQFDRNGRLKWAGLLQALATNTSVNLLSTPSVLTLDNQEASIMVGQNVPFVTGRYTSTNNTASNPFQTIQREDVGINLKVTPHLGSSDSMRLELNQEVSSVIAGSASQDGLTTNKREIKTTVLADDGQTIVLGGLIQDDIKKVVKKVPILGSIPLIGALFRSTHDSHERSNLVVFLRPTIVRDGNKLVSVTRDRYIGVMSLQFRVNNKGELKRIVKNPLPIDVEDVFEGRVQPTEAFEDAVRERLNLHTEDDAKAEQDEGEGKEKAEATEAAADTE